MGQSFTKQPSEKRTYKADFSDRIASGTTITSVDDVTVSPSGLTLGTHVLEPGNLIVSIPTESGADRTTYTITIFITASDTQEFEAEIFVTVVDSPSATGFPNVPAGWLLEPGHRYLKSIVTDLSPTGDETKGVTQQDLDAASCYAWRFMISRFIGNYVVTSWGFEPPQPLFEIWDLFASSVIVDIVAQRMNYEEEGGQETSDRWFERANEMIKNVVDPEREGDRMHLIGSDGTVLFKRKNISSPKVFNTTGAQFFPSSRNAATAWGDHLEGSVEEFIDTHSRKIVP